MYVGHDMYVGHQSVNQKLKVNSADHCSHCTEKTKDQEKKEKRDMS